jgi:hypothetical protein
MPTHPPADASGPEPLDYAGPHPPIASDPPRAPERRPAWVGWAMLFGTMFIAMILILAATLLAVLIITRR